MSKQPQFYITYLAPAQRNLLRLKAFLINAEVTPLRANEIIKEIVVKLRILANNPHFGFPIGKKYGFSTPYRALICGKYIAIYEVLEADNAVPDTKNHHPAQPSGRIEIRRIYHSRENYISQLINDTT